MKLFIQASAEDDLLRQFEWYAEQGLPDIARRFTRAVRQAIDALSATPGAGSPMPATNPQLAGLRTWPVKGFDEFKIYYVPSPNLLMVLRILHGKRDVGSILQNQTVANPGQH